MFLRSLALLGFLAFVGVPELAQAYCRTRTTDRDLSTCPGQCETEGFALRWFTSRIYYTPNERGFPGFRDAELRAVLARSFASWTEVRCDDEPVGLELIALEAGSARDRRPEGRTPMANVNAIALLNEREWRENKYSPAAYAITGVWYDRNTGEIVGADTLFNGGMGRYSICPERGCPVDSGTIDLENVATHEFGHFLGLSHSDVPGSTMWCGASSEETEKRSLAEDDIEGLCAAYGGADFPRDYVHYYGGGACTLAGDRTEPLGAGLLLALLGALCTRRARSAARRSASTAT